MIAFLYAIPAIAAVLSFLVKFETVVVGLIRLLWSPVTSISGSLHPSDIARVFGTGLVYGSALVSFGAAVAGDVGVILGGLATLMLTAGNTVKRWIDGPAAH